MAKPAPTIKVTLSVQYCGPRGSFPPGTTIELPVDEAKGLLEGRHAVPYAEPEPVREVRGGSRAAAKGADLDERRGDDSDPDGDGDYESDEGDNGDQDDDIDDIGTVSEAADDDEPEAPPAKKPRRGKKH